MDYTLPDGSRQINFTGDKLAHATSDDGRAQRWTEFTLYRTSTSRYVLHKVGRSVVYHTADSTCTKQAQPVTARQLLEREEDSGFVPCITCAPAQYWRIPTTEMLLLEQDRHQVIVSETARGVVEGLQMKDPNGTLFFSKVAERLIRAAAERDPAIQAAWQVQTV